MAPVASRPTDRDLTNIGLSFLEDWRSKGLQDV